MAFAAEFSVDKIDKKTGFPSLESALHFLPAVLALTQYLSEQNVFENDERVLSQCVDLYHTVNKYVTRCIEVPEPGFEAKATYRFADVASVVAGLNAKLLALHTAMGDMPAHGQKALDGLAKTIFGFAQEVAGSVPLKGEAEVHTRARAACNALPVDPDKNPLALVGLHVLSHAAAKKFKAYAKKTHHDAFNTVTPVGSSNDLAAKGRKLLVSAYNL